jgi:hypothetical protein
MIVFYALGCEYNVNQPSSYYDLGGNVVLYGEAFFFCRGTPIWGWEELCKMQSYTMGPSQMHILQAC